MIDGNPDDQVQVPPQPQRSEKFYHLSGDIIIQVELTLYRLHRDILSKFSEAFEDILSLPGGEGRSDEKAFVLETIKQTDFDCLMGWIYEADLRHTPPGGSEHIHFTYETLVSILKLATLYQMAAARTWAIERIEAEATITAAQRMYLAEQYSVPHWIAPAVKDLLQRPILSYSSTEIELLTPAVAFVLAKAQAKFFDTLLTLGHVAPELRHAFHCTGNDRARCEMVWKETWWTKVARGFLLDQLHRPDLSKLCDFVAGLPSLEAMTWSCKHRAIEGLRSSSVLHVETRITEKAVEAITAIHSRYTIGYYTNDSSSN